VLIPAADIARKSARTTSAGGKWQRSPDRKVPYVTPRTKIFSEPTTRNLPLARGRESIQAVAAGANGFEAADLTNQPPRATRDSSQAQPAAPLALSPVGWELPARLSPPGTYWTPGGS
jgi:hypothetical protein